MEIKCSCGKLIEAPGGFVGGRVKCPACGGWLSDPDGAPDGESLSFKDDYEMEASSQRGCGNCGSNMTGDAVVCMNCGTNITTGLCAHTTDPTTAAKEKDASRASPKRVVLIAAGVVAMAVGAFLLARGGKTDGDSSESPPPPPKKKLVPTDYLMIQAQTLKRAKKLQFLLSVQSSIRAYRGIKGRYPASLDDLAEEGMRAPALPEGIEYKYDPKTGAVDVVEAGPPESP